MEAAAKLNVRNYDRFYVRYELAALVATWWRHGLMPWLPSLPEA